MKILARHNRLAASSAAGPTLPTPRTGASRQYSLEPLLTVGEVAAILRCSPRTVRRLPIPFVRRGRARLYEPAAVRRYVRESTICPSTDDRERPTTTQTLKSKAVDFYEALRLHPIEKRAASAARPVSKRGKRILRPAQGVA